MLTTLGPGGWETVRENPDRISAVRTEVEHLGLRVVAQYALMGQYDFLNIIEAPDERTMARAAVMLAARGTMRTTTMQAIPVDDLIALLKEQQEQELLHPPELAALLFTYVVVGEEDGQHRVVGPAPNSVTRVATLLHDLGDLETARPVRVEPRSNLDTAPRMHAPDGKPLVMRNHQ
jgi:uncharacterized protein with GYD domain